MSDKDKQEQQDEPAAEPKNTGHMIPKARFDEVNERMKAAEERATNLEKRMAEQEAARKASEQASLEEQQEYKTLYEQAKAEVQRLEAEVAEILQKAGQADALRETLQQSIAARVEALPDDARTMVPEYDDPAKTLAWLDANMAKLVRPPAPSLDGGAGRQTTDKEPELTPAQQALLDQARRAGYRLDANAIAKRAEQMGRT